MNVVMIGPFGFKAKSTMSQRALPMARALVKRGHKVTIIVPPWDSPEDAGKSRVDAGVQVVNTLLPKLWGPFFHLQLIGWLVRLALQAEPDVVHLFKPKAYAGLAHVLLHTLKRLRRHTVRLIVDEDDLELAWNAVNDYTPAQKLFFSWQEPWGLTHADAVTVASKGLERLAERLGVAEPKIVYVPNGVRSFGGPVNVLKAFSVWQEELATVVAAAGLQVESGPLFPDPMLQNLSPQRGNGDFGGQVRAQYNLFGSPVILLYTRFAEFRLSTLMKVILEVARQLPQARWLVVGKGYFSEEAQLATLAKKEGVSDKLIFAGWVPLNRLSHYFAAANVALHLYENTPINQTKCSVKLLDLLAAGVPVVASNVGQNAEYIRHPQTGFLVEPDDLRTMADALVSILNSSAAQKSIGQEAARHVNRAFNWNVLVEGVEAIYQAS